MHTYTYIHYSYPGVIYTCIFAHIYASRPQCPHRRYHVREDIHLYYHIQFPNNWNIPVTRGHLKKCPYMTVVPSSQVHFNVKVYFGSQNLDIPISTFKCPLITGFTVYIYLF